MLFTQKHYKMFILEAGAMPKEKIQTTHIAKNQFWFRKGSNSDTPEYVSVGNGMVEPYNPQIHAKNKDKKDINKPIQGPQQPVLNRNTADESRLKLFTGQEKFIGTAGSATGETFGVIAAEQVLSGEMVEFFNANGDKIESKLEAINALKGSSKKALAKELDDRGISAVDYARMLVWVDSQLETLKQYESNPDALINKLGESELRGWLKVAYWTGYNEATGLKDNENGFYTSTQPPGYPVGVVVNAPGRQSIVDFFTQKMEEDPQHYKNQLKIINHLQDADTAIIYAGEDGKFYGYYISNKKTTSDPHFNTYPKTRLKYMIENAQSVLGDIPGYKRVLSGLEGVLSKVETDIQELKQGVSSKAQQIWNNTAGNKKARENLISSVSGFIRELPGSTITQRRDGIEKILGRNPAITQYVEEWERVHKKSAPDSVYVDGMFKLINGEFRTKKGKVIAPSADVIQAINKISAINDAVVDQYNQGKKISDIVKSLKMSEKAVTSILKNQQSLSVFSGIDRKFKDASAAIHNTAVGSILELDKTYKMEHPGVIKDKDNGPASQLYIDAFMEGMHWNLYIDGYAEGSKSINMDGLDYRPDHFTRCLGNLSGYDKFPPPRSRKGLKEWLRKRVRLSATPGEDHISIEGNDVKNSRVSLGVEVYRAKGESTPVMGFLGKDLIRCLKSERKSDKI